MRTGALTLRAAGLLATGAVAVHELRYLLGGAASDPGAGHGYLPLVGLLSTVLLGLGCAQLAAVVERARRTGSMSACTAPGGFLATWILAALALLSIFLVQESLEGLLAGGRVAAPGALVTEGGWLAVPASVAVGGLLALALAGARSAITAAARTARGRAPRRMPRIRVGPAPGHRPGGAPLARHLAGRAPPPVLS